MQGVGNTGENLKDRYKQGTSKAKWLHPKVIRFLRRNNQQESRFPIKHSNSFRSRIVSCLYQPSLKFEHDSPSHRNVIEISGHFRPYFKRKLIEKCDDEHYQDSKGTHLEDPVDSIDYATQLTPDPADNAGLILRF